MEPKLSFKKFVLFQRQLQRESEKDRELPSAVSFPQMAAAAGVEPHQSQDSILIVHMGPRA